MTSLWPAHPAQDTPERVLFRMAPAVLTVHIPVSGRTELPTIRTRRGARCKSGTRASGSRDHPITCRGRIRLRHPVVRVSQDPIDHQSFHQKGLRFDRKFGTLSKEGERSREHDDYASMSADPHHGFQGSCAAPPRGVAATLITPAVSHRTHHSSHASFGGSLELSDLTRKCGLTKKDRPQPPHPPAEPRS